jgi:CheY-like chemotaxis protein
MTDVPYQVFLADDDEDDVMLFREAVAESGWRVVLTVFSHGRSVCTHIQEATIIPDLIFLDINMPLMNGRECLIEIRKNPKFKAVPVIMHSTASYVNLVDLYQQGASLYVVKPSSFREQVAMLKSVFQMAAAGALINTSFENFVCTSF